MKLFFGIFFLSLLSISTFSQKLNLTTISGRVENAPSNIIFLSELGGNSMIITDSAIIKADKTFSFSTNIPKPNFYQLSFKTENYAILVIEPREDLTIDLDANAMIRPYKVSGSPNTQYVYTTIMQLNIFDQLLDSLNTVYNEISSSPQKDSIEPILIYQYQQIVESKNNYLINSIGSNPMLASLLFIDKLEIDKYIETYVALDNFLMKNYSDNIFARDLHSKVEAKTMLMPGKIAPEIALSDPNGKIIKLSSLKGKYVIIDFWASWCSPCRRANPTMVRMYNTYHSKGLEIYGVSLDKEKEPWIQAIKDDGLNWIHVSDLLYWSSVAAKTYGVGSIPFTVLIDKEGKIIATGLHAEELEKKIATLLK